MINGKQKNQISKLKNSISNVFSSFTSNANNMNLLGIKHNKSKSIKTNTKILGKTDSNKTSKSKKIIYRNNISQSINLENSFLNNNDKVYKTFDHLNNNLKNIIFNPITLENEEKGSSFKKENKKKIQKTRLIKQQKQKLKENKLNNNKNVNKNNSKNILNFHRCKSENDLKKIQNYSPTYYGYKITFPSNILKSQSNDFKKQNNINNKEEESQKILSVKVVYYLEYIEKIILIQKFIRGFLFRKTIKILKSKLEDFSNHINSIIFIYSNLSKKFFLNSLKLYSQNILYKTLIKPVLNEKITISNLDKNENNWYNNSYNIEDNKQNIINKRNNNDNIILGLHKKTLSPNISSSNSNLITKTFNTEFISSKISERQLRIENIFDLQIISKNKKENFAKYKELYMNALKENEQLIAQLKQTHKSSQSVKMNNKKNINDKRDYEINSKLNEINIINGMILKNINYDKEINNGKITNNIYKINNINSIHNDNDFNYNQIQNKLKAYNQSTCFLIDKNISNSSPTLITKDNTLSSNRKGKFFKDILAVSQNINFKLESVKPNKKLSVNKLSSFYIQYNKISSFKSLSIIKEKENNIKSNQKNKSFNNLEIYNNMFYTLNNNNKQNKKISILKSNFSIINNKKKDYFEIKNLNEFSILQNTKYQFQIEQNKYFLIKNDENKKKFQNIFESKIQSIFYESLKSKNKKLEISKENNVSIQLKNNSRKKNENIFQINSNTLINVFGVKKFIFSNQNNEIFKNNFELISKKEKIKKENIPEETISLNIINEKIQKENKQEEVISFNIIKEKIKKEIKQEEVISFNLINEKNKKENKLEDIISFNIINEKIKKENQAENTISFEITKKENKPNEVIKDIKNINNYEKNTKKETIKSFSIIKTEKNNEKKISFKKTNKDNITETIIEKVIFLNIINKKINKEEINSFKKLKEENIHEEVISFNISKTNKINKEKKNNNILEEVISFNIIKEEKQIKNINKEINLLNIQKNKENTLEEVISFNIMKEENKKDKNKEEKNKEGKKKEEEKKIKENNNFIISNLHLNYLPKKIEKQNKENLINQIIKIWINLPTKISKYISNYNKSYVFHTLINYMKALKKKNKINKNMKKLLVKFVNKKNISTKTNYFSKYKEIIKIEKIIEKYSNQKKQIKKKLKKSNKEKKNEEKNNEKNEENEEEKNYHHNRLIKSSNFNFSTEKKSEENALKFSNDFLIKSTNFQEEKNLKKGLLNLDRRTSQDFSKKIVPLKTLKVNSSRRKTHFYTNKLNNPLYNSSRIVLKKKPISFVSEVKNSYLENLIKIKDNQNKKKCFIYWKNNSNLNQLFTFRQKESLNKNKIKVKKSKRQLRIKYVKKKKDNNVLKDNSNSLSSDNCSKAYKQMKITHKIFDGSGEITSINASRSSKVSENFTNIFDDLTIKDSIILDRFMNVNKIYLRNNKYNSFNIWKNNVVKLRRKSRKIASNKKNLVKYLLMMMIYNFTYLEPLKKSLDNRKDYLLGKSLFIWYRHLYCFHKNNNID